MKKWILTIAVFAAAPALGTPAGMAVSAATEMTAKALDSEELKDILRGNPELDQFQGAVINQKDGRYIVSVDFLGKTGKVCSVDIEVARKYRRSISFASNSMKTKVIGLAWVSEDCLAQ